MSTIAIDGPGSSGKSSVGERVARELGYAFLDTGLLYRAVTAAAIRRGAMSDPAAILALAQQTHVNLEQRPVHLLVGDQEFQPGELESAEVERAVPRVAALPDVRAALRGVQRSAAEFGNAVLAGRDIGTVVLPEATWKFFLDASAESRGERRSRQRGYALGSPEHASIVADLSARDFDDRNRIVAPLVAASDAQIIVTDQMTLDEVVAEIVSVVQGR